MLETKSAPDTSMTAMRTISTASNSHHPGGRLRAGTDTGQGRLGDMGGRMGGRGEGGERERGWDWIDKMARGGVAVSGWAGASGVGRVGLGWVLGPNEVVRAVRGREGWGGESGHGDCCISVPVYGPREWGRRDLRVGAGGRAGGRGRAAPGRGHGRLARGGESICPTRLPSFATAGGGVRWEPGPAARGCLQVRGPGRHRRDGRDRLVVIHRGFLLRRPLKQTQKQTFARAEIEGRLKQRWGNTDNMMQ